MFIFHPRWNRLGLQVRIMAYVTVGLVLLFGGLAYFGMRTVNQASGQVLNERSAFSQSLAMDLDDDFQHLAFYVRLAAEGLNLSNRDFRQAADRIYQVLGPGATGRFIWVSSLRILDGQGELLAAVPEALRDAPLLDAIDIQLAIGEKKHLLLRSQGAVERGGPFASLVVPISADWAGEQPVAVVVDTTGMGNVAATIPGGGAEYSVEILGADGMTLAASAETEPVGEVSSHYPLLKKYMDTRQSGAEVHRVPRDYPERDHIAAVSPLASGPFYLVLEQPVDLALALPRQQQSQMLVVGSVGLILTLLVAWYTTRAVVRPVKQLRATARTIAQGKLDSPVQITAQDEGGEVAEDIETMRGQLKRFRDDLERAKLALERQVRERTQRLHETLGKVITAQEEERRRLARELHDEQGQALGAISISLDRLSRLVGPAFPQVQKEIEQARDMARVLLQETRRLIYDLRPSVLDDMGLEAAIRWSAETHLERHGVEVTFHSSLPPGRLSPPVEVALFRVAQEAITNIERHAQARHAGIVLEQQGSSLLMQVRDDGRGFDPGHVLEGRETGVGLEGMQERVLLIGGRMEVVSAPGQGTLIKVEVPLD